MSTERLPFAVRRRAAKQAARRFDSAWKCVRWLRLAGQATREAWERGEYVIEERNGDGKPRRRRYR